MLHLVEYTFSFPGTSWPVCVGNTLNLNWHYVSLLMECTNSTWQASWADSSAVSQECLMMCDAACSKTPFSMSRSQRVGGWNVSGGGDRLRAERDRPIRATTVRSCQTRTRFRVICIDLRGLAFINRTTKAEFDRAFKYNLYLIISSYYGYHFCLRPSSIVIVEWSLTRGCGCLCTSSLFFSSLVYVRALLWLDDSTPQ